MLYGKFVDNSQNKQELKYNMINGTPYLVIGSLFNNPLTSSEVVDNIEELESITTTSPEKILHHSLKNVYYGSGVKVLPVSLRNKGYNVAKLEYIELGFTLFTSQRISHGSHAFKPFGFALSAWLSYEDERICDGLVLQSKLVNSDYKYLDNIANNYEVSVTNSNTNESVIAKADFDKFTTLSTITEYMLTASKHVSMNVGDGLFFSGYKINIDEVAQIEIKFGDLSGKIMFTA